MTEQQKAFDLAVTALEGMGTGYAVVVPIKDGMLRSVKSDGLTHEEYLLLVGGLKSALDACKPMVSVRLGGISKYNNVFIEEGEIK